MSQIPNMLESTIQKIREMVDVNSVIGEPISTPDGVTIIPVSKVSVGFGGGGSDFTKKTAAGDNPFGGGVGGGVKVTPVCFPHCQGRQRAHDARGGACQLHCRPHRGNGAGHAGQAHRLSGFQKERLICADVRGA